jgi:hypothetical protein
LTCELAVSAPISKIGTFNGDLLNFGELR